MYFPDHVRIEHFRNHFEVNLLICFMGLFVYFWKVDEISGFVNFPWKLTTELATRLTRVYMIAIERNLLIISFPEKFASAL